MQITEIITDDSMRELRQHGTAGFPFEYYYDDIRSFAKQLVDWHWHREFEFCYAESGTVICSVNSSRIYIDEGDGIFINSRAIHRFETENNAKMPNILFSPELIASEGSDIYEEYIRPVLASGCEYIAIKRSDKSSRLLLSLLTDAVYTAAAGFDDKLGLMIKVCRLWHEICPLAAACTPSADRGTMLMQSRMRTMMQFITDNYKEKINLADIAASASISKSEALRCFHSCMGITPVKYLTACRLERAKKLLLSTDNTVTQIAVECGIDNISYFTRIFTAAFGITPKAYRSSCGRAEKSNRFT